LKHWHFVYNRQLILFKAFLNIANEKKLSTLACRQTVSTFHNTIAAIARIFPHVSATAA